MGPVGLQVLVGVNACGYGKEDGVDNGCRQVRLVGVETPVFFFFHFGWCMW